MSEVYQGYTQPELAAQYDVETTIDDLPAYQAESAQMSADVRDRITGNLDIPYGPDALQKLDIFGTGSDGTPVLIDIHGGGWRSGTKNTRSLGAAAVTQAGAMWVPIDYGLAPDYRISDIVHHARQAVAWVYGNIKNYGGDPGRIYVSGNSAGGHLTGTMLMPGWQDEYGIPADSVKGVCAMSGVFDLEALVYCGGVYNNELQMDLPTARAHSPYFHVAPPSCPAIIAYGEPEPDEFKRQSVDFAKVLEDAGYETTLIEVPGAHHFAMSRQIADSNSQVHKAIMNMVLGL